MVTGAADPAQPARDEREAYADAQIQPGRSAARRQDGTTWPGTWRLRMPDRPSERQMAPWEAVLAQALQQDEPERTALEAMQAAQDFTTHGGHLFQLRQAFWWLDVAPQIDEQIRQRISPRAYERYLLDPERPALLQELRAHEIGGRAIAEVLDSITAAPLDGLRSIAAGLHGRLGKEPPPARGETRTWAERTPAQASADIRAADLMADGRQAELGEQIARQAPQWATQAWGAPPAEPGALQDDWRRRAGLVGYYREVTGITDPAQAIGPPPSAQADLAELFRAAVRELQLADDAAMLKAMNRGQLEAQVQDYRRAEAVAPPDVQAQVGDRQHLAEEARARAEAAAAAGDVAAQQEAEAEAARHAADLASLAVADAARREWREATAAQETAARGAAAELRRRGIEDRIPVTDAEVAETSAQPRPFPEIDPAGAATWRAEQTARVEAGKQARREAAARATPVTEAEIAEVGTERQPEAGPADGGGDRAAVLKEIRAEIDAMSDKVDQFAAQDAAREAERRAEMDQADISEAAVREPQAEPSLEPSWQPGDAQGRYAAGGLRGRRSPRWSYDALSGAGGALPPGLRRGTRRHRT